MASAQPILKTADGGQSQGNATDSLTFLTLLGEIRNSIYELAFDCSSREQSCLSARKGEKASKSLGILLTCRQAYREARILAFHSTTFEVELNSYERFAIPGALRANASSRPDRCDKIRRSFPSETIDAKSTIESFLFLLKHGFMNMQLHEFVVPLQRRRFDLASGYHLSLGRHPPPYRHSNVHRILYINMIPSMHIKNIAGLCNNRIISTYPDLDA